MYGWAWALRLVAELHGWDDADGKRWRENLRPLEAVLVERVKSYLPLLTHPIRTGEHPDTGFALRRFWTTPASSATVNWNRSLPHAAVNSTWEITPIRSATNPPDRISSRQGSMKRISSAV